MIKALWFLVKIAVLIALAVWLAELPGDFRFEWQGYVVTAKAGLALIALLAFIIAVVFFYQVLKTFVDFPRSYGRYSEVRAKERGYRALTRGLTAVAAGDAKTAKIQAQRAGELLKGDTGLPVLLAAQVARMEGREDDAALSFAKLLENPDASFLGVRGLLQTALDVGDDESAVALAEKALALHPKQAWILKILYSLQIRNADWLKAEKTLRRLEKTAEFDPAKGRSDRIALFLAQAEADKNNGFAADAAMMVQKAQALDPLFTPATLLLADVFVADKKLRKARKIVLKAWKSAPNAALAQCWLSLNVVKKGADEKAVKLHAMEILLKQNAHSAAGQRIAGELAAQLHIWGDARDYFKRAEDLGATMLLYKDWADMEERAGSSVAVVHDLLEKASRARADKVWVCHQTGNIYERWSAVASPHNSFNTIFWDFPFAHGAPILSLDSGVKMQRGLIDAPE